MSPAWQPADPGAVMVASGNGPAAAVTPGSRAVAASWAAVARAGSTVAVTCAPCCAAKAWSNGRVGVDEQAERQRRRRRWRPAAPGRSPWSARGGRVSPPRAAAPGDRGRRSPHRRAPASASLAIRPSTSCDRRGCAYRAARSGLWVTRISVCPDRVEVEQQLADLLAGGGVQRPGRLVGEQQRGPVHQRPGDRHPLPLAAGQPGRVGVGGAGRSAARPAARRPAARGLRPAASRPAGRAAGRCPATVMSSSRLKNWKIMPTCRRRNRASAGLAEPVDPLARPP